MILKALSLNSCSQLYWFKIQLKDFSTPEYNKTHRFRAELTLTFITFPFRKLDSYYPCSSSRFRSLAYQISVLTKNATHFFALKSQTSYLESAIKGYSQSDRS